MTFIVCSARFQHRRSSYRELQYICDGDDHGVLYFAGTSYGEHQWVNPLLAEVGHGVCFPLQFLGIIILSAGLWPVYTFSSQNKIVAAKESYHHSQQSPLKIHRSQGFGLKNLPGNSKLIYSGLLLNYYFLGWNLIVHLAMTGNMFRGASFGKWT